MPIQAATAQLLANLDLKPNPLVSQSTTTNGHTVVDLSAVIAGENNKTPSKPHAKKETESNGNFTLSSKAKQIIAIALVIVGVALLGLGFMAEIVACSLSGGGLGSTGALMYYLTSDKTLPLPQKPKNPEKPTSPANPAAPVLSTTNNNNLPVLPVTVEDSPPPLPPRKPKKPKPAVLIAPGILGVPFLPPLTIGGIPKLPGTPGVPSIPPICGTLPTPTIPGIPSVPPTNGLPPGIKPPLPAPGIPGVPPTVPKPGIPNVPPPPNSGLPNVPPTSGLPPVGINPGTPGNPTLPTPGNPGAPPVMPKPGFPNVPPPPTSGLPNVPPTNGLPPVGINPTIPGVPPTLPTPSLPTPGTPYVPPINIGVPPIGSTPGTPSLPPPLPRPGFPVPPTGGIPPVGIKPTTPGLPPIFPIPIPFIPPVINGVPPALPEARRRPPKLTRMPRSRKLVSGPKQPIPIPVILPIAVPPISTTTNNHKVINLTPAITSEIDRSPLLNPKARKENAIHFAKLTDSLKAKQQKEKQNIKKSWFTPKIQRLIAIALAVIGVALAGLGFFAGFAACSFPGMVLGGSGAILFFLNQSLPRAQKPLKPEKVKVAPELKSGLDKILKKKSEELASSPKPGKIAFERLKKINASIDPKEGFQRGHPNVFYLVNYKEKKWFCPQNGIKTKK
jgi:hypothetical protein